MPKDAITSSPPPALSGSTFLDGVKATYERFVDWTAQAIAPKETDGTTAKTMKVFLAWIGSLISATLSTAKDAIHWTQEKIFTQTDPKKTG